MAVSSDILMADWTVAMSDNLKAALRARQSVVLSVSFLVEMWADQMVVTMAYQQVDLKEHMMVVKTVDLMDLESVVGMVYMTAERLVVA